MDKSEKSESKKVERTPITNDILDSGHLCNMNAKG